MNNRDLLIGFLNYCQEQRQMPVIDDNTFLVDDYLRQQNLQQCNVSGSLPLPVRCLNEHIIKEGYQVNCPNINCCELCRRQ